jgi:putative ATP-binding cassette transporter
MKLFKFILQSCRGMGALIVIAAILSGAANAGLLAVVNAVLHRSDLMRGWMVAAFIGLAAGRLLTSYFSQMISVQFSQDTIARLRRNLVQAILHAPLRKLEELGAPRLLVALTDDVYQITQALLGIPILAVNVALLLGGAAYLAWLSWPMLCGLLAFMVIGAVGHRLLTRGAFHSLIAARGDEDKLFGHFRALTEGIKELKLHRERRGDFFSRDIQETTAAYQRHNVTAENRFALAQHWSHLLLYVLIGVLLFLPGIATTQPYALTGYVITALYLMGPLSGVLSSFTLFGRANVALDQVERLGISLAASVPDSNAVASQKQDPSFKKLELTGVTHSYHHEKDDSHFIIGPIDLTFRCGEIVFLVGGNGSGKSTLAKIIAGLYPPESGEIRLDGKTITEVDRDDYRQLFSAVFADFYLFDSFLGLNRANLDQQAEFYLRQLHLDRKVKIQGQRFSTLALSQGQRKRLALLTAYLEDRPFYLFDEWASDQDPQFKDIFYRQLLPDLKTRGKTVLVITHDDKYFPCADRIIKLDYGQIVGNKKSASRPSEDEDLLSRSLETRDSQLLIV